ncbi:MAG: LysM peptidoglycan-binding domain-containing protein [Anaerolineae bacterium]|nr:LysM peptidoglycan-binding domain-containing protein [Anaerolineae bacterium]
MQRKIPTRALLLTIGLLVVMTTAGCFQPAGSGSEFSQIESNPTFTPPPTETPFVPPSDTPEPLAINPDLATAALGPTDTPIVFPTAASPITIQQEAALPTSTEVLFPTQVADAAFQEANPFALTATFIVGQATAQAGIPLTQTAEAVLGVQPTATPIPGLPTATPGNIVVQPGVDCIHEVQSTDQNLYRISLAYGVPVADIAARSGVTNINLILVGQKLTIPGCGTTGYRPPPTSTPSGTDGGGQTTPPSTGGRTHIVDQGETLFEISLTYGVRVADIASANGISNINYIQIGQQLVIP